MALISSLSFKHGFRARVLSSHPGYSHSLEALLEEGTQDSVLPGFVLLSMVPTTVQQKLHRSRAADGSRYHSESEETEM